MTAETWVIRPPRRLLAAFNRSVWAILPEKFEEIAAFIDGYAAGRRMTHEEFLAGPGFGRAPEYKPQVFDGVAVIPMVGPLVYRADMFSDISGGVSAEKLAGQIEGFADDPDISAIVLHADTPGGLTQGMLESSDRIFAAREKKPIVAVADSLMASAGYWLGSQASEIVVSPSAHVGSIGVFGVHTDYSQADEKAGYKRTLISAGRLKTAGNQYEPLTDEAREILQAEIDEIYQAFVGAVARGRKVSAETVKSEFGEGLAMSAKKAVSSGLADRVGTLRETVSRLQSSRTRSAIQRRSAAAKLKTIELEFPAAECRKEVTP